MIDALSDNVASDLRGRSLRAFKLSPPASRFILFHKQMESALYKNAQWKESRGGQ